MSGRCCLQLAVYNLL